jgi:hypothetical protein
MNRHPIPDMELQAKLDERGLTCHLLLPGEIARDFPSQLCDELEDLLSAAYGREITPEHFATEMWAVTLSPASGPPIACSTLTFYADLPSYFTTRFEAVHPTVQKTGLGRLLYDCVAVWTRFLVFNDVYVLDGVLRSSGSYCLVSVIDAPDQPDWELTKDNEDGHGTFLQKLGFIRAQHDFRQTEDEIAFQREFHIPVEPELEARLGLPLRPATA